MLTHSNPSGLISGRFDALSQPSYNPGWLLLMLPVAFLLHAVSMASVKSCEVSEKMQALSAPRRVQLEETPKEFFTRMKRSFALIAILASGFALSAAAQTAPAPAGPAKAAVIAFQAAVGQTNEFQRDFADLQKKFDPKRAQLKGLSDELESLEKQLQAQGDKLSDSERASRTKIIEDKKKQAQRLAEDSQSGFQEEMQELYNGIASKVYEVLVAMRSSRN